MSEPEGRLRLLQAKGSDASHFEMVGASPAFLQMTCQLRQAASWNSEPVLLIGERGCGKEMAANALHLWSERRQKPYLTVFVAGLCETLLADELFGHERNSFTGALTSRMGRLVAADQGTIFLDEIGDLSFFAQQALLRLLETGEITPIGKDLPKKIDIRIVAATNKNLPGMIDEGKFRADLYDRLKVFHIRIPPLRERPEDIPLLASFFLKKIGKKMGCAMHMKQSCTGCAGGTAKCASRSFYQALQVHDWWGNVRELRTLIIRARSAHRTGALEPEHLSAAIRVATAVNADPRRDMEMSLEAVTRQHIGRVLASAQYNIAQAAKMLCIPPTTLRDKMKRLKLNR